MKIHVRRRHIVNGIAGTSSDCPVALAFRETTGALACVGYRTLSSSIGRFALPAIAHNFIVRFDNHKPVKPFAFVLK